LLSFFQDGRVSILDLPCGSGGGLFGLLCTIAELRRQFAQARLPVDVHVHAADISPTAMEIHREILKEVEASLGEVGIRLYLTYSAISRWRWLTRRWKPSSGSDIFDMWMTSLS
jgi:methylase of polypeptide subunit release factors